MMDSLNVVCDAAGSTASLPAVSLWDSELQAALKTLEEITAATFMPHALCLSPILSLSTTTTSTTITADTMVFPTLGSSASDLVVRPSTLEQHDTVDFTQTSSSVSLYSSPPPSSIQQKRVALRPCSTPPPPSVDWTSKHRYWFLFPPNSFLPQDSDSERGKGGKAARGKRVRGAVSLVNILYPFGRKSETWIIRKLHPTVVLLEDWANLCGPSDKACVPTAQERRLYDYSDPEEYEREMELSHKRKRNAWLKVENALHERGVLLPKGKPFFTKDCFVDILHVVSGYAVPEREPFTITL